MKARSWLAAVSLAHLFATAPAHANGIAGPDTATDSDSCCSWSSFIIPDPAVSVDAAQTDYLLHGLDVAGFKLPGWDIQYKQLTGTLTIPRITHG